MHNFARTVTHQIALTNAWMYPCILLPKPCSGQTHNQQTSLTPKPRLGLPTKRQRKPMLTILSEPGTPSSKNKEGHRHNHEKNKETHPPPSPVLLCLSNNARIPNQWPRTRNLSVNTYSLVDRKGPENYLKQQK